MFTSMLCLLMCTNHHIHFSRPTTFNLCGSQIQILHSKQHGLSGCHFLILYQVYCGFCIPHVAGLHVITCSELFCRTLCW
jgi:hypothetical protein